MVYQINTKKVTHVFALTVILMMMLIVYGSNFLKEMFFDAAYTIKDIFTPQINYYGNYKSPYFY